MCCFGVIAALNELARGAVADGFFGEEGLLADAAGDFGEFAFVDADGGKVVELTDEIEGAQGFPDLLVAGIDGGDFGSGGDIRSRSYVERANSAGDRCADFCGLIAVLNFCDQAVLMDGGTDFVGVGDAAGGGGG